MRMTYFILTSSFLILLTLLFRCLFHKKLSPSVIYALWLIPYLRLLMPFGVVEVPMFGAAANFLNNPFYVTDNSEKGYEKTEFNKIDIYSEYVMEEQSITRHNGTKVYDSVSETDNTVKKELNYQGVVPGKKADELKVNASNIALTIWLLGTSIVGLHVIIQNRKLRKETDTLDVVGQIEGIDICMSHEVKTPCLVGVGNVFLLRHIIDL